MKVYLIDEQGTPSLEDSLEGVSPADCKLIWVDVKDPSLEEREYLRDFFDLHPLAAERPLEMETVPRVVEFNGHLLTVWNMLRDVRDTESVEVASLYMILGDNYLITAHVEDVHEIDTMFKKLQGETVPRRDHPAFFLYTIINVSVEEWFPMVEGLKDDIDDYMEEMLADDESGDISTVMSLKHKNMAARRTISALRDVVMRLARRDLAAVPDELGVYLMDIYDRLTRLYLEVDNNSDLISSSLDIHLSVVSNRLNVTMKRLTAIATFFMPATFLAGVYGMNFIHMPEYKWYYGYLFFWIVIIVITVAMFFLARRQEWF
ncbi:MAG: magnesium/cobalt transporter CorA [Actinobacteria bacterium]|nr:magnesium/cobalt transporter CorA [Actinomycetota bacterium]